jgi:hypothetical protein
MNTREPSPPPSNARIEKGGNIKPNPTYPKPSTPPPPPPPRPKK